MHASCSGNGNDKLISLVECFSRSDAVRLCDLGRPRVKRGGDGIERFTGTNNMKAPAGALLFGYFLDAREIGVTCAWRYVEIKRHVVRCAHAQQTGIERD